MPTITDKFGKASIPTDVAIATTVKTTRNAGVAVLEANDLSKYAVDTPVFVVTYKKTTDPVTGVVSVSQLRSWKALVNVGANTLTNLTIQPGYADDIGNAVGDFIECIPTSAWENSLIDGIRTSLNDDGTLKTSAVQLALNQGAVALNGWNALGYVPSTVVSNGNRSYTCTVTGIDLTGVTAPGYRLRFQSSVARQNQCTLLNGTTQYWTKASPSGIGFTVSWVQAVCIKITAYPSTDEAFSSRSDGSNGFWFGMNSQGQVIINGSNGAAANYRRFVTKATVPLNKEVWIVGQMDMTVGSGSPTTTYIMIDGADAPGDVLTGGTAPTAIVQPAAATAYQVGAINSVNFFGGKIAQEALFNTKVTQAIMRGYCAAGFTGGEANNISVHTFNGNGNDSNVTNNNTMTSVGGVTALTADSPFGLQNDGTINGLLDYGIIQTQLFTGGNTVYVVQAPEGNTINTGSIAAVAYSNAKEPYQFPIDPDKWRIEFFAAYTLGGSGVGAGTYNLGGVQLNAPVGKWRCSVRGQIYCYNSGAGGIDQVRSFVSTQQAVAGLGIDPRLSAPIYLKGTNAGAEIFGPVIMDAPITVTTQQNLYVNQSVQAALSAFVWHQGNFTPSQSVCFALENAYL